MTKSRKYIFIGYDHAPKTTSYTIHILERLLLIETLSLMKKNTWEWSAQEGNYDTPLPYEKKE